VTSAEVSGNRRELAECAHKGAHMGCLAARKVHSAAECCGV